MDFFEVVKNRHSIRKFKKDPVDEKTLRKIIETALLAPSAGNLQSYEIIVVRDKEKRRRLAEASLEQMFIATAPVVLVICANEARASAYGERGRRLYSINDASIVASYIQLAAVALGLGSVWIGAFDEEEVRRIIEAPKEIRPIAILPIGYPAEKPIKTSRKKFEEIVHYEKFKE